MKKTIDPIGKLIGLRYKSHPWHGVEIGEDAPDIVTCYVEIVSTDTVKYEVDKLTGYLKIDRPQKYSNFLPALYGFVPQTYCDENVAAVSRNTLNRPDIVGDHDPLDICILTEKNISHGDILVRARPIGGFRLIDGNQADDKIIAVLKGDGVYGDIRDISDCPKIVIERLRHYFLTYKDMPGTTTPRCELTHVYGATEAKQILEYAMDDYRHYIENLLFA